ncbi:MAG: hypothetical protein JO219_11815 [Candidatus Eremiobacteraeota bacterium]|nr:hypothetical protein [Candidatus Eremiobacteraeota bacterium]MBV8367146.1 hypothetical protein [Candidatus Eremiobacteraeota bacterium]
MTSRPDFGFSPGELRVLRGLRTPAGIQKFLDAMPYHLANTAWSPRRVLAERSSHCLEGAIFAAAALRVIGFPPLVMDFEAEKDTDHVIAPFRIGDSWGALAKSNYTGCRYREPVYASVRELAMSYFNDYFNLRGRRSMRTYSRPISLARFDNRCWMTTDKPVWFVAEMLLEIPHRKVLTAAMIRRLTTVDARGIAAGLVGRRRHAPAPGR